MKEKDDSGDLCHLVYLISGVLNMHYLQTWGHHIGVNLKESHCIVIGIGLSMVLNNLSGSGV